MYLIPLAHGSKVPIAGASWKDRMSDDPAEHRRWLADGLNVGYPVAENRVVVADFDTGVEAARRFYREHRELFSTVVRTRKGIHGYFSGESATYKWEEGDIKGSGYVVYPPSTVDEWLYQFVQEGELQPFPADLFPHKAKRRDVQPIQDDTLRRVYRAMKWAEKVEPAVEHAGWHNKIFWFCCSMRAKFGLTMEQAYPIILAYNARCQPSMCMKGLKHKLEDAFRKGE